MTKVVDQDRIATSINEAIQQLTHSGASLVPVVATARDAAEALGLSAREWISRPVNPPSHMVG
jgi:hypothetical protein